MQSDLALFVFSVVALTFTSKVGPSDAYRRVWFQNFIYKIHDDHFASDDSMGIFRCFPQMLFVKKMPMETLLCGMNKFGNKI